MESLAHALGFVYEAETGAFRMPLDSYEWCMQTLVKTGVVPSILRISSILERENWRAAEVLEEKAETRRVYKRAQCEAIVEQCEREGKMRWIATESDSGDVRKRNVYAGTPFGVIQRDDRAWYVVQYDGDKTIVKSRAFIGPNGSKAARRFCELTLAKGVLRDGDRAWVDREKAERLQSVRITPDMLRQAGYDGLSRRQLDAITREAGVYRRKAYTPRHAKPVKSLDCDGRLAAARKNARPRETVNGDIPAEQPSQVTYF